MKRSAFLVALALASTAVPAIAATNIAFTFVTTESDFLMPKAAGVVSRQYSGSGNILFNSTLTDGTYGLGDIAAFQLDLRIDAIITNPQPNISADFRFDLTKLNSFSITYSGGVPVGASFSTNPVLYYQSTAPFNPAPASVDFYSAAAQPLTINAYLTPNVKTPFARTTIVTRITNTAAVPESATWAMMIAGMGLAGTALRHRRRTLRAAA
jgi:hypothetical protein